MELLYIIIGILFFILILNSKSKNKIYVFFIGLMFFPQTIILFQKPYIPFPRFLVISLLISIIIYKRNVSKNLDTFPLKRSLYIVLISLILIGIFDTRINVFLKFYRPITYFVENFFILFLSFCCINSRRDGDYIYKKLFFIFFIVSIYGFIVYILKVDLYSKFIAQTYSIDFNNDEYNSEGTGRFRVASFTWHPIYYGFLLSIVILGVIFYLPYLQNKFIYIGYLLFFVANLILTNSRTPIGALFTGYITFFLLNYKFREKIKYALIAIVCLLPLISVNTSYYKIVDDTFKVFSKKSDGQPEGSSLEMRSAQMAASLGIFSKNPILGNGFGYIFEDLEYSGDGRSEAKHDNLFGFESYIYELLIEQGIIGIIANMYFFISIFVYFFNQKSKVDKYGKRIIYISLSMVVTFVLFIIGTGDLGSFTFFMCILGCNLKLITLSRTASPNVKFYINEGEKISHNSTSV